MKQLQSARGFTLIEMLTVLSIIALFAAASAQAVNEAREKAYIRATEAQLRSIRSAVDIMSNDTSFAPGGIERGTCTRNGVGASGGTLDGMQETNGNGLDLQNPHSGLLNNYTAGKFPNWEGPYITTDTVVDQWGNPYWFDRSYQCTAGEVAVTKGLCTAGDYVIAVHSGGPNGSGRNTYDADNIAEVICDDPNN